MNRRQKIIVSVTGIFLVLLIIIGLTYAYFLTKVNGNTNSKSISVSTANLALVYGDGNGIISGENIQPGTILDEKTFTVKNAGNATTDYVVVIEDVYVKYPVYDGTRTELESNDFVYTLTCTSDGEDCDGKNTETTFPINGGTLIENSIEVGKTHSYTLTVTYKETGTDQSNDMDKVLTAKVNIKGTRDINPFIADKNSLNYNIINNSAYNKNGTTLTENSFSIPAASASGEFYSDQTTASLYYTNTPNNWPETITSYGEYTKTNCESKINSYVMHVGVYNSGILPFTLYKQTGCQESSGSYYPILKQKDESILTMTTDELGTTYYYRGNVKDNYVNFADMCWRIVRILGDGSIKLILEDQNNTCETSTGDWVIGTGHFGHSYPDDSYGASFNYLNYEGGMADAFKNFQTNKLNNYLDKMVIPNWYWNDNAIGGLYDTYYRLEGAAQSEHDSNFRYPTATLIGRRDLTKFRDGTKMYVGALTMDEIVYTGSTLNIVGQTFINDSNKSEFYTLSPAVTRSSYCDRIFIANVTPSVSSCIDVASSYRPVIALKSSVTITTDGNGTKTNPYVIQ